MVKKNRIKNKDTTNDALVVSVNQTASSGLEYEIAFKTVGNAPFFKDLNVCKFMLDKLDARRIETQVQLRDVRVFAYGISFKAVLPPKLELEKFVRLTAQRLIQSVNKQFPELELKSTAPNGSLSRLWHRPYYIKTLTPLDFMSLSDYLK